MDPTTAPPKHENGGPPIDDPYYILAPGPLADESMRVLKQGDTFAIFDRFGDIKPTGLGEEGLYHAGTRYLSTLLLRVGKDRPLLLSSSIKKNNDLLVVDLTNPDIYDEDRLLLPRGTLHIFRSTFLWEGVCYHRLRIKNFGMSPVASSLWLTLAADFADIFEVRGTRRQQRGAYLDDVTTADSMILSYHGLDGVRRQARFDYSPAPQQLKHRRVRYDLALQPKEEIAIVMTVCCDFEGQQCSAQAYDAALTQLSAVERPGRWDPCCVRSSHAEFNEWIDRATADLKMMTTKTSSGLYPYAGVPWFSTVFGRDGIITALQYLWLNPHMAQGVLGYLATHQARDVRPEQEAEPGKILHEVRSGEMAALGEIPFGKYYGSVDATPLFIMLAGAYFERTGDRAFIESIWPNIELALDWIDQWGDADGDGYVEYYRQTPKGLAQQGWKDSYDSVFHEDGMLATGPIALCEVQGYVYAARCRAAEMAIALNRHRQEEKLLAQARTLQDQFERDFWCEHIGTYVLALDGDKRPCRVRTSNAGHCLWTGIATPDHGKRTAHTLLEGDFFSGWGIRTLASRELRYNPMSYHNGSIWPHDNAIVAAGLARYGLHEEVGRILTAIFEASTFVDFHRLPELFCGFRRRPGEGPTLYPVACSPQAWSAGAVFMLLQASLGMSIDGPNRTISFRHPCLPEYLRELRISNLHVGDACVDLLFQWHTRDVGVNVLRKEGDLSVSIRL